MVLRFGRRGEAWDTLLLVLQQRCSQRETLRDATVIVETFTGPTRLIGNQKMTRSAGFVKVTLIVSGLLACLIGLASLVIPVETEAGLGIIIGSDIGLLNELRASGGGLAAAGLFIIAGAFISELVYSATLFGTMLYLGYGGARFLSIMLDGKPDPRLLAVMGVETVFGVLCLVAFLNCRHDRGKSN